MDVNVVGQSSHSHSSWLGGSIVATDSNFYDWIMTREQYEEVGPTIARQSVGVSASDLGM
jgi:actin-related protein